MKIKFKDLTEKDILHISYIYYNEDSYGIKLPWEKRAAKLGDEFGTTERTIRKWCAEKLGFKIKDTIIASEHYKIAKEKEIDCSQNRFIITWAQNNTPIHEEFFKNIKAYAKYINADIHVIAGRYKNPTSVFTDAKEEFWADDLLPYLDANRHNVHKYLSIMSDIKIQPTATNPMTGLEGVSGINSCIFGAPKVHFQMIPVLQGNKPKAMATTGAVTLMNYTDSKSGKKGEFHHTYGFIIVEIKNDDVFYFRQVTANDKTGTFNDLYFNVTNGEVKKNNSIEGIVLGDLHWGNHDEKVLNSTMNLLNKLTPQHVILHDVFDGNSINHHEIKDPFIQYGKEVLGTNDLGKEIEALLKGLELFSKFKNVVIVRSNHDDFLDRWLKNEDWKKQPTYKNSRLYMKMSDILLEQYGNNPNNVKGVIPYIINEKFPEFITLDRSTAYRIKGWELGQHGDISSNGSRGSLMNFRKLNTKIIVGHSHTPCRLDGALSVGTSTKLRVGYNVGPSSWAQSHVIIHNDGRTQHINFITDSNNEVGFTTFKYK